MRPIFLLFPILFLFSCNPDDGDNGSAGPPQIDIRIEGVPSGMPVFLMGFYEGQERNIETTIVQEGGLIRFAREEPYPPGCYFIPLSEERKIPLLLDRDQQFSMKSTEENFVADMEVEGSLDNELLYRHLKKEEAFKSELSQLLGEMSGLEAGSEKYRKLQKKQDELREANRSRIEAMIREYPNTFFSIFKSAELDPLPPQTADTVEQNYLQRQVFWDNFDFKDPRYLYTPLFPEKLLTYFNRLTAQHPDSIISSSRFLVDRALDHPEYFKYFTNWIIYNYRPGQTSLSDSEAILVFIVKNYLTYDRVFWADSARIFALHQRVDEMASSLLGQKGQNVEAKDPSGKLRSIYEIDAPYIVIFIYNPDCSHCIEETPKMLEFYHKWKDKGVEVYAIAVDTDTEQWEDFIEQFGLDWVNVFDPSNAAFYGKYYVDNTPEIYVLDRERKIIGKNLKAEQIEDLIKGEPGIEASPAQ